MEYCWQLVRTFAIACVVNVLAVISHASPIRLVSQPRYFFGSVVLMIDASFETLLVIVILLVRQQVSDQSHMVLRKD
jgi:hypothetical protein